MSLLMCAHQREKRFKLKRADKNTKVFILHRARVETPFVRIHKKSRFMVYFRFFARWHS